MIFTGTQKIGTTDRLEFALEASDVPLAHPLHPENLWVFE